MDKNDIIGWTAIVAIGLAIGFLVLYIIMGFFTLFDWLVNSKAPSDVLKFGSVLVFILVFYWLLTMKVTKKTETTTTYSVKPTKQTKVDKNLKPYTVCFRVGDLWHHEILAQSKEDAETKASELITEVLRENGFVNAGIDGEPCYFCATTMLTFNCLTLKDFHEVTEPEE